jgi:osomolarity two-component system sensor histidine kinase SLN1
MLGDSMLGYPPNLFPNFTYVPTTELDTLSNTNTLTKVYPFDDFQMTNDSVLLLGPMQLNETFAMVSLTLPILNNTDILGFMT